MEERFELKNARHLATGYMLGSIRPGDTVVDATMGNGKDTVFLAELVGEDGHVYAFDVQPEALERTREKLAAAGLEKRCELILDGHQNMQAHVPQGVQAIIFNLGWLPGAEHVVTTMTQTTLQAVSAAVSLVCPGGIVSICVYPGHEEGQKELAALKAWASGLDVRRFNVCHHEFLCAREGTPQLILVQKNRI